MTMREMIKIRRGRGRRLYMLTGRGGGQVKLKFQSLPL
jgi:hypothetical protein